VLRGAATLAEGAAVEAALAEGMAPAVGV
jgi:hypothetical protein